MKKMYTWAEHIERCSKSDLSKKQYCHKHQLSYAMFFYHQRKLSESNSFQSFSELVLSDESKPTYTRFSSGEFGLRVRFDGGAVLYIEDHHLERVIELLQRPR